MLNKLFKGELVENRIVIWDIEKSKKIFGDGYYGKRLGVPKPKGTDFDAPLILDLIEGYHLVSEKRLTIRDSNSGKVVSKRKPTLAQLKNLIFAFNVCRYVKSNAIVIANNKSTLGIGSGQPNRLDSCKIAIEKMHKFRPNNFENLSFVIVSPVV
mgnify:CR=1 FL=1